MKFNDFLLKRLNKLQTAQNRLSNLNIYDKNSIKNVSIFQSASAEELSNVNFDNLLNSSAADINAGVTDQNQMSLNSILKEFLSIDEVQKAADVDGNGKLTASEAKEYVESLIGKDGDLNAFTMADLDAVVSEMDIDLNELAATSADEAIKELEEEAKKAEEKTEAEKTEAEKAEAEKTEKAEKKEAADDEVEVKDSKKTEEAEKAQKTSSSEGGSQGSSSAKKSSSGSGSAQKTNQQKTLGNMSLEELKSEEAKAKNDLNNAKAEYTQTVNEQNGLVNTAVRDYQTALNEIKGADSALAKEVSDLHNQVTAKERAIDDSEKKIQDKDSAISDAESKAQSADGQISELKSFLGELKSKNGQEDSNGKKIDLSSKIDNVETQIQEAQKTKEKAIEDKKTAETEKQKVQEEKTNQQKELAELNSTLTVKEGELIKNHPELQELKNNIDKAKETKTTEVGKAQKAVQDAQNYVTEVGAAITKQTTSTVKKQNSLNQYSPEAGKKLAEVALHPRGGPGGYCSEGVDDSLEKVYGLRTNCRSAYQVADVLASDEGIGAYFTEVEGVSRSDLKKLPPGYIVVWDRGGTTASPAGQKHGHVSIALGDGRESSDLIWGQTTKRDVSYRVFCPTA